MGMSVSRRMVGFIKTKSKPKKKNKLQVEAPSGQQSRRDELSGARGRPYAPLAAPAIRELPWWEKAIKPTAYVLGGLVCSMFAYVLLGDPGSSSRSRTIDTASTSAISINSPRRSAEGQAYPGSDGRTDSVVLSNRSTQTDTSFMATAYMRKRVALPRADDGRCVIKGNGNRVVGECPQQ